MSLTKRFYEDIAEIVANEGSVAAVIHVIKECNMTFLEALETVNQARDYFGDGE